ncbi:MAG: metal-dependent hydrolase, partial [bacterium]|nr:metal-dependent hydrolase [bacterium]
MTPPEHFLIGASLANVYYSFQSLLKSKRINYLTLLLIMGIAAIFPDIDSFFGHYTSVNPIIGHRGMTHSIIAVIIFGFILTIITFAVTFIIMINYYKCKSLFQVSEDINFINRMKNYFSIKSFIILFIISSIAGLSHLIADLPQPAGIWNGIPLLFPLKLGNQYIRNGGFSLIGWYDYSIMWLLIKVSLASFFLIGV